jgi:hypothetical protein
VVALVATPALTLGALAAVPAPSYAAPDPTPAANGATWLAGELTDGLVVGDFGPDYGLSIDVGSALAAVPGQEATVSTIAAAVESQIDSYVSSYTYTSPDPFPNGPEAEFAGTPSNGTAKAAAFALSTGSDPSDFGGRDLIADLEALILDAGDNAGRLTDRPTKNGQPDPANDFANTIGQSFGARALAAAGSPRADAAVDFLIDQQCAEGFFRLSFAAIDAANQTCDADAQAAASTDVTGLALLNLLAIDEASPAVEQAAADAVDWLVETQGADGSWGGDAPTTAPNANSTGLAGWALSEVGNPEADAAAEKAAVWLRSVQADDFGPCTTELTADNGAIAYDGAALAAARSAGVGALRDQFRRSTAQALPALLVAPAGTPNDASFATFARPGQVVDVRADDVAPGQTVCISGRPGAVLTNADDAGTASVEFTLPANESRRTFRVAIRGEVLGDVTYRVLEAKRFAASLKSATVPAGKKQRVTVRGLATGEAVTVRYRGDVVVRTIATGRSFSTAFEVRRDTGKQRVVVVGEFGNRRAVEKFRVVKAR